MMAAIPDATSGSYIGARLKRPDGPVKVCGEARYAADLSLPGQLHVRLVLSPHAHARIVSVNGEAARSVPGVVAVVAAQDLVPYVKRPPTSRARCLLAEGEVRYCGQPVVAVLAGSDAAAEDALGLVEVEYEELPAVLDTDAALAQGAQAVWPEGLPGVGAEAAGHGVEAAGDSTDADDTLASSPNVAAVERMDRGDVEAGLAEADVVVRRTYRTPIVHQSYVEPHATLAAPEPGGGLTIWSSTQGVFLPREETARVLGWTDSRIRLIPTVIGGGFGGKGVLLEPLAGVLAVMFNRPIKIVLTRMDELLAATPAPRCQIDLALGAKRDGTLTAVDARIVFDAGLYPGSPVTNAMIYIGGLYRIPNFRLRGYDVVTNTIPQGAYRAPGAVQGVFAIESAMDELAQTLDIDPIELRLKSCIVEGDLMPHGQKWARIGLRQCLETLREHPAWKDRAAREHEGVGVAIGALMVTLQSASALCRLESDGTITAVVGSVDISGSNTALTQITAEAFGLPIDRVAVSNADSTAAPHSPMSGGSKITLVVGAAIVEACHDARQQAFAIAADQLEADLDDLELVDGRIRVRGAPERNIGLDRIHSLTVMMYAQYPPVLGRGNIALKVRASAMAAHLARVRVDPDTGRPDVVQYVAVHDVGRAINPAMVEENVHGGVSQGIGWALHEQMLYDEAGRLATASLLDYTVPGSHQIPTIEPVILEIPSQSGPYGLRGVGEPPVIPVAAAIANAVSAATGHRQTEIPITSESLYRIATRV
ncbi:MAG TPA: xanthine dehydrogenase family protein molybdopterin-binding subunit [Chloroflexota bacterium]|nr:xanthine dehydrogenase family protein molybdopterin-binding subunit [Chloroflexota bacterium]